MIFYRSPRRWWGRMRRRDIGTRCVDDSDREVVASTIASAAMAPVWRPLKLSGALPRCRLCAADRQPVQPSTVLARSRTLRAGCARAAGEDGFEYEGQRYRSLTVIAERITGAHWSGPRFFARGRCLRVRT